MDNPLLLLTGDFVIQETSVAVSVTAVPVVGQDPTRWALIFDQPATAQTIWVSTKGTIAASRGMSLNQTKGNLLLNFRDYGALTQQAWFAIASAVAQTLTVIEVLYRPVGWEEAGPELLDELAARYAKAGL